MTHRLEVAKTYKLFIDGKFPRSESGRTIAVTDGKGRLLAHVCRASRKDLRDALAAARKAQEGWASATAYLRGQVLYRLAEMMEGKRAEFEEAIREGTKGQRDRGTEGGKTKQSTKGGAALEVAAAIDRLVCFAGWADKYAQVLGCNNPVAGPYYNFTVPQPTGVVAVIAPDEPALLGLISLIAPPLCAGNAVVALGGESPAGHLVTSVLGEVLATGDVPPGVVNLLTGHRDELVPIIAAHRDIDAVHAAGVSPEHARILREGVAENVKRVTVRAVRQSPPRRQGVPRAGAATLDWTDPAECHSPWWIEPFVEMKTIWHPSAT